MTPKCPIIEDARERILQADISLLNDFNVSDDVMTKLAAEHAARSETLLKAVEPTLGRATLLMLAGALMAAAKQITDATVQQPELINV